MNVDEAIAVFDKSAQRTRPNAQTEAWTVIRAELEKREADERAREESVALVARVVNDTYWRTNDNTLWPDLIAFLAANGGTDNA